MLYVAAGAGSFRCAHSAPRAPEAWHSASETYGDTECLVIAIKKGLTYIRHIMVGWAGRLAGMRRSAGRLVADGERVANGQSGLGPELLLCLVLGLPPEGHAAEDLGHERH